MACEKEFAAWKAAQKNEEDLQAALQDILNGLEELIETLRDRIAQIDKIIAAGLSVGVSANQQSIRDYERDRQALVSQIQKAKDQQNKKKEEVDKAHQATTTARAIYEKCFADSVDAAKAAIAAAAAAAAGGAGTGTSGAAGVASTASSGSSGANLNSVGSAGPTGINSSGVAQVGGSGAFGTGGRSGGGSGGGAPAEI